jgi:hypothetical protein
MDAHLERQAAGEGISPRRALPVLAACLLLSALLHLVAVRGANPPDGLQPTYSDTPEYLEVVALLRGLPIFGDQVPRRVGQPGYPLLIACAGIFTSDWVKAAQIAALVPSVLIAPVLCLIAWVLDARFWSGFLAGIVGAFSWPLVELGIATMSDAPFTFLSALSLLSGLLFLKRASVPRALAAGGAAGLAWCTRGPGLFYLVALVVAYLVQSSARREDKASGRVIRGMGRRPAVACLVLIVTFFAAGKGPTLLVRSRVPPGLRPPTDYLKETVMDESFARSLGMEQYHRTVYVLNEDCTDFAGGYQQPWPDILRKYGRHYATAIVRNVFRQLTLEPLMALRPFTLAFLPLAVGLVLVWQRNSLSELVVIALFAAPFVFIIPLITLETRFLVPLAATATPLTGIGLAHVMLYREHPVPGKRWAATGAGCCLLLLFVLYGTARAYWQSKASSDETDLRYRQACAWILKDNQDPGATVMSSGWSVYAHTRLHMTTLPADPLPRVVRYARNTNTRYIVLGPADRKNNPPVFKAFDKAGATAHVGGATLRVAASFGEGEQVVRVVTIDWGAGPGFPGRP